MNIPFLIVFEDNSIPADLEVFFETIRSSFVSKRGSRSLFIISAPEETKSEDLFKLIRKKSGEKITFVVAPFRYFYGMLDTGVFAWIIETFPHLGITVKPSENKGSGEQAKE